MQVKEEGQLMIKKLDVLFMHVDGVWIVQGLQFDIAAQGATMADAREAFALTMTAQIALALHHQEEPFATFQPAAPIFWEKFSKAEALARPIKTPPFEGVPPAFQIPQLSDCRVYA